jgi:HEAT repeat protein
VNLATSDPPPDLPYEDLDDWQNQALLDANGISSDVDSLVAALRGDDGSLRPVAAHGLGTIGAPAAEAALDEAAGSTDDQTAVEAAWSLARHGKAVGVDVLRTLIERPVAASVVPLLAAGYLARAGGADGFPVIQSGLQASNFLLRIAAAKQLFFFVPMNGEQLPDGTPIDPFEQYARCLRDENEDVRWAALYQLRSLRHPAVDPMLRRFITDNDGNWMGPAAAKILSTRERPRNTP